MTNLNAFLKLPTEFQKKCLIYPPTINEVVGNPNFDKYHSLLCLTQEDIEDALNKDSDKMLDSYPTPFEFLMANASRNSELAQLTREAFYFFIKEDVTLLYEQKIIIIGDLEQELSDGIKIEQLRMISTEEDFFAFQNAIRAALGEDAAEPPDPNLHPKARAMKAKARYRDRIKAKNK